MARRKSTQVVESVNTKSDNWHDKLRNDDVFPTVEVKPLSDLTGLPCKPGKSNAIIANGEIVNIVSNYYGHMDNANFFLEVERKLIDADIQYVTRSINRGNASFAVDYILKDERFHIDVKTGKGDQIMPMMRFTSSYDSSEPSAGSFGIFRKVCENGLNIGQTKLGFRIRHTSQIAQLVLPNIEEMVVKFMDNEFYELKRKFDVLSERPITNLEDFVKYTAGKMGLFKFEMSEKNPDTPSANAKIVMDTINRESAELGTEPTLWLGYNAFNEFIHSGKKPFAKQRQLDRNVFDVVAELAN